MCGVTRVREGVIQVRDETTKTNGASRSIVWPLMPRGQGAKSKQRGRGQHCILV